MSTLETGRVRARQIGDFNETWVKIWRFRLDLGQGWRPRVGASMFLAPKVTEHSGFALLISACVSSSRLNNSLMLLRLSLILIWSDVLLLAFASVLHAEEVLLPLRRRLTLVWSRERYPPRKKSRTERLKAKLEPLLTQVTVDSC